GVQIVSEVDLAGHREATLAADRGDHRAAHAAPGPTDDDADRIQEVSLEVAGYPGSEGDRRRARPGHDHGRHRSRHHRPGWARRREAPDPAPAAPVAWQTPPGPAPGPNRSPP